MKILKLFGYSGILTILIYAFHGYQFGYSDMTECLSYMDALLHPDLYKNDLFISALRGTWINERFFFTVILSLGAANIEIWAFVLHLITLLFLAMAWVLIAHHLLKSKPSILLFCLLLFIPLQMINIGGNEMVYNYFVPSLPAKMLGSWAFYFFFNQ